MSSAAVKRRRNNIILLGLVVVVLLLGFLAYKYLNPGVGFTYYEPAYLPPNVSVKARRISISSGFMAAEQNFRTVDWVYEIQEYKNMPYSSIGAAQQNYDPKSIKPTCSILSSPAKQQYRLCHWIDYGRIDVQQVVFIRNGTYIRSHIPTNLQQQITIQQIGKYVDSFGPKSTAGLPVLRSSV